MCASKLGQAFGFAGGYGTMRRCVRPKLVGQQAMDGESAARPETRSPQGGLVFLVPSDVLVHGASDEGFERDVLPRTHGESYPITLRG